MAFDFKKFIASGTKPVEQRGKGARPKGSPAATVFPGPKDKKKKVTNTKKKVTNTRDSKKLITPESIKSGIGKKTQRKVVLKQDPFKKPNYFASNLRNNNVKNIAIVIPDILNYFFAKVIKGAQKTLFKSGYNLTCFVNDESISKEKKILEKLKNRSVAGIIISFAKNPNTKKLVKELDKLKKINIPTVMFDRVLDDYNFDKVSMDNHAATLRCVKHLTKKGKKKTIANKKKLTH